MGERGATGPAGAGDQQSPLGGLHSGVDVGDRVGGHIVAPVTFQEIGVEEIVPHLELAARRLTAPAQIER